MRLKISSTKYYIYTSLDGIPDVTKDILPSNTLDFTYNFQEEFTLMFTLHIMRLEACSLFQYTKQNVSNPIFL